MGGRPGTYASGRSPGSWGGRGVESRLGGREELWFGGRPGPAAVAVSCAVLERAACEGKRLPREGKGKEASSGHCPDGVVVCWPRCVWGARPALSSVGKARVGACRSAEVGTLAVGLTPRACPGVAVGAPVDVYLPLPEVSGLLRAGSRPSPRSSLSRGSSRSSTSPPPSFHLSRNGAARVHGGFVLRLRFSPGAGRCPVSPARPPLAWSSLAGFADSWLRPEGQGASRFPDVAPRCCVLGGGARCGLRPPVNPCRTRRCAVSRRGQLGPGVVSRRERVRLAAARRGCRRAPTGGLSRARPRRPPPARPGGGRWCGE